MIHSILVEKLNKYWWLQACFVFLPVMLVLLYLFFYIADISRISAVLTYNSDIVKLSYELGTVMDVTYMEKYDYGYEVTVTGMEEYEELVQQGDVIFSVYIVGKDWFKVETKSGKSFYQSRLDWVTSIEEKEDGVFSVSVGSNSLFEISSDELFMSVLLDEDGSYLLDFTYVEDYNIEECNMLTVQSKEADGYIISVHSAFTDFISDANINFCNNLPTDNLYFDMSDGSYIRNVSSDFSKNFILGSNILVVLIAVIGYCVLLQIIKDKHELFMLEKKFVLYVNVGSILILLSCIALTIVIFS